jgi:serine/threonine protein kinase
VSGVGCVPGIEQWVALDAETGRHVLVSRMPGHRASQYESIRGERHLHLAGVLDLIHESDPGSELGSRLVVAEFVPGCTLAGLLRRGPIHPFKAVAWLLRLVDAVSAMHKQGGLHGAISPRSIVVEPVGRAIAPVLAQLVSPPIAAYCAPERLEGTGPEPQDDLWALHVTLYVALTGSLPFSGRDRHTLLESIRAGKPKPLAEFGVQEPVLAAILERGLCADQRLRTRELADFMHALDAWERGRQPDPLPPKPLFADRRLRVPNLYQDPIVFDESDLPSQDCLEVPEPAAVPAELASPLGLTPAPPVPTAIAFSTDPGFPNQRAPRSATKPLLRAGPPPLPVSAGFTSNSRASPRRRQLFAGTGVVAVLLAIGGFYWALSTPRPQPIAQEGEASAQAGPARSVAQLGSARADPPGERLRACVVSYFSAEAFEGKPDFGFLCQDEDLRRIAAALFPPTSGPREAVDAGQFPSRKEPAGLVVRASQEENLGWYELVTTTVVRSVCCQDPPLPVLPKTEGWCQQLQGEVRKLAEATRKSGDLAPYARRFEDAVVCLYATGTTRPYRYEKAPTDANRRAFQLFLKHAAESDGMRSRMSWLH